MRALSITLRSSGLSMGDGTCLACFERRGGRISRPSRRCQPRNGAVSEYQYYEFLAVDRPLTEADRTELRATSSWARITSTSFTNVYNYLCYPTQLRPHKITHPSTILLWFASPFSA
jgi:hypothetical protein